MKQWYVVWAVGIALAVLCQNANAGPRRPHTDDPRLTVTSLGVGAASTAGFFALRDWRLNKHGRAHGLGTGGAVVVTTVGCLALSPIVGTLAVSRELTFREAYGLAADCIVPFIGGWLVNKAFDAHPEWEPRPPKRKR